MINNKILLELFMLYIFYKYIQSVPNIIVHIKLGDRPFPVYKCNGCQHTFWHSEHLQKLGNLYLWWCSILLKSYRSCWNSWFYWIRIYNDQNWNLTFQFIIFPSENYRTIALLSTISKSFIWKNLLDAK